MNVLNVKVIATVGVVSAGVALKDTIMDFLRYMDGLIVNALTDLSQGNLFGTLRFLLVMACICIPLWIFVRRKR